MESIGNACFKRESSLPFQKDDSCEAGVEKVTLGPSESNNLTAENTETANVGNVDPLIGPYSKRTCPHCKKVFSSVSAKTKHIKRIHKILPAVPASAKSKSRCLECRTTFASITQLRDHLHRSHGLNMTEEKHIFPNISAFMKWKHDIQLKEMTNFPLAHSSSEIERQRRNYVKKSYSCYRSGKFVPCLNGPRQRMLKIAGSCKIGIACTAAIYAEEHADKVVVSYFPNHYGHVKEGSFIPSATTLHTVIKENISKEIPLEHVPGDTRQRQIIDKDSFQLNFLKKRDLRFINNAFKAVEYNGGLSDAQSVDRWVYQCFQLEDCPILFYKRGEEEFLLIIMTEFQKQLILASDKQVVCIDSAYRLRRPGRFYLTVIFTIDKNDIAFPVAFCISHKVDKDVILQFYETIKKATGPLSFTYFMSDSENFFYDTWLHVMQDDAKWLWSMWYFDGRIRTQLKIFKGNMLKERAETYKTMRVLLECQSQKVFESMFKHYVESLMKNEKTKKLGKYLQQNYGNNAELWAYCYRKDIKLSTNIHLEGVHITFKICCREGRKNRIDKFIAVIMKLLRYKMLDHLTYAKNEVTHKLVIESINAFHAMGLKIMSNHISSLSDKIWLIEYDEEMENAYVTREFNSCPEHCSLKCAECDICVHMYTCSCMHSMVNGNLCQHIHAVVWKFLTPHFSPPPSPMQNDGEPMEESSSQSEVLDKHSKLSESIMKMAHDVYKIVRSNKSLLSEESLNAIKSRLAECLDIGSGQQALKNCTLADTSLQQVIAVCVPNLKNTNFKKSLSRNDVLKRRRIHRLCC